MCFAAALCWMLQAWSSRSLALTVTVLAVVPWEPRGTGRNRIGAACPPRRERPAAWRHAPRVSSAARDDSGTNGAGCAAPCQYSPIRRASAVHTRRAPLDQRRDSKARFGDDCTKTRCLAMRQRTGHGSDRDGIRQSRGHWQRPEKHLTSFTSGNTSIAVCFRLVRRASREATSPTDRIAQFYKNYASPPVHGRALLTLAMSQAPGRFLGSLAAAFGLAQPAARGTREAYRGALLWIWCC